MLGWFRAEAALASRRNRSRAWTSLASSSGRNFRATKGNYRVLQPADSGTSTQEKLQQNRTLNLCFQGYSLDQLIQRFLCLLPLLLQLGNLFVQDFDFIFLLIELPGVSLHQSLFFCAALQRLHVLPHPLLVFGDARDLPLARADFLVQRGNVVLL